MNLKEERVFLTEKVDKYQRALEINYEELEILEKQKVRLKAQFNKYQDALHANTLAMMYGHNNK